PLARKERILGHRESLNGSVVATDRALLLRERNGTWQRIGWTAISWAAWSEGDHCVTLRLWPTGHDSHQRVRVAADRRLAAVVRERVEYQRLLCVPVELPGNITGWVVALRDGDEVRWRVLADTPLDSPALRDACALAIAEIRSLAGL